MDEGIDFAQFVGKWEESMMKQNKLKSDMANFRLSRMLREMVQRGEKVLPKNVLVGVTCEDGFIILSLEEDGFTACMIPSYFSLPDFWLYLSPEEMREFNGGKGLKGRHFKVKE
jgi:hypothetical protein